MVNREDKTDKKDTNRYLIKRYHRIIPQLNEAMFHIE